MLFAVAIQKPPNVSEAEIEEFCKAFGLLSPRDTSRTVVKVFRVVVRKAAQEGEFKSAEIAEEARVNRITAIHHLNRLLERELLEKDDNSYRLRQQSFQEMFEMMAQEQERMLRRMRILTKKMDEEMRI